MREVKLHISMSLDGFVASDRQHPGTTVPEDEELVEWKASRLSAAGAHLMGRVTYLEMASFWPTASGRYADIMNSGPKIVFSKTLTEADWPTTRIARGELAEEIAAIKAEPGADVVAYGGAKFVAALAADGLIDEYVLAVQPLALGRGQGLFAELPEARGLELVEARSFPCGIVVQVYRPR